MSSSSTQRPINISVAGRYRLGRKIGSGSFGDLFVGEGGFFVGRGGARSPAASAPGGQWGCRSDSGSLRAHCHPHAG
jgi:hypothetical protein